MKTIIGTTIQEAIHLLKSGELVAIPTETYMDLQQTDAIQQLSRKFMKQKIDRIQIPSFFILQVVRKFILMCLISHKSS